MTEKGAKNWLVVKIAVGIASFISLVAVYVYVFVPIYEASEQIKKISLIEEKLVEVEKEHEEAVEYRKETRIVFDRVIQLEKYWTTTNQRSLDDSTYLDEVYIDIESLWSLVKELETHH